MSLRGSGSRCGGRRRKGALWSIVIASLSFCLSACATIERPADALVRASAEGWLVEDPRVRASDEQKVKALSRDIVTRIADAEQPPLVLALSGGGANGAFGAGVLVGWTETGQRPEFAIVSGVSTGALAAPFAFLGPEWDDSLREAYAGGRAQGVLSWRGVAALAAPGLFSPGPLSRLVERAVTPELLRQVAREHSRGRRLFVVTTNLDAEETVIWDMGVLASQGGGEALSLFRKVLLASASIPGVFPPVLIAAPDDQGRLIEEMHVDGGVNTPFLGIPEGVLLTRLPQRAPEGSALYVLVNGRIDPEYQVTRGSLPAIVTRAYGSMAKSTLRTSIAANLAFAERNGLRMYVASMPADLKASSLDFSQASMAALFERGRAQAAAGDVWFALNGAEPVSAP